MGAYQTPQPVEWSRTPLFYLGSPHFASVLHKGMGQCMITLKPRGLSTYGEAILLPGMGKNIVELEVGSSQEIRLHAGRSNLQGSTLYVINARSMPFFFRRRLVFGARPLFISAMQSCNYLRASANFNSEVSACCLQNSRTNFCCSFCGSLANWASFSWLSNEYALSLSLLVSPFGFVDFSIQSKSAHSSKYNWKKEGTTSFFLAILLKKQAIERNALWLLRPFFFADA